MGLDEAILEALGIQNEVERGEDPTRHFIYYASDRASNVEVSQLRQTTSSGCMPTGLS